MRLLFPLVGVAALAATILASAPLPARADVLVSGLGPSLCATVYNNALQLNRCNSGDAQNWFTTAYGAQHYHGLCLDSASSAGGSQLVVVACQNKPSQRWAIAPNGQMKNESGWCVDVNGGQSAEGTRIQIWTCNASNPVVGHQRWADGRMYTLSSLATGAIAQSLSKIAVGEYVKILPAGANAVSISTSSDRIVAQGGGNIVAQGGGNIVAQGGGNIVAQGGGNIVVLFGGSIVAQGGGN